jgi:hypothetical protein
VSLISTPFRSSLTLIAFNGSFYEVTRGSTDYDVQQNAKNSGEYPCSQYEAWFRTNLIREGGKICHVARVEPLVFHDVVRCRKCRANYLHEIGGEHVGKTGLAEDKVLLVVRCGDVRELLMAISESISANLVAWNNREMLVNTWQPKA